VGKAMNDFGNEVKKYLKFHNKKQWQLARQVGVDPAYLSKILRGWFPVKEKMRNRILAGMKTLSEGGKDE